MVESRGGEGELGPRRHFGAVARNKKRTRAKTYVQIRAIRGDKDMTSIKRLSLQRILSVSIRYEELS